ncbi:bactofilin family protein [Rubritalea tangerina]|uniref:Polymer-forming cytoskeletal protein n=1 Tax=Rubritalea tangerina TaxID=430798 RepID=A0ABW4ZFX9_9BACT
MSVFKKYISNQNEGTPNQGAPSPSSSSQSASSQTAPSASSPAASETRPQSSQKPIAEQRPKQQSNTSQIAAGSGRNMLSSDVEIKGQVRFTNDLVVDGKIEGEIDSDGSLTVGENARVRAEIRTRSVVIYGKVHGNITVADRVELKANAELVGDIKAATLSIEAGAIFVGKSTVGAPSSVPAQTTPNKPAASAPAKKEKTAAAS